MLLQGWGRIIKSTKGDVVMEYMITTKQLTKKYKHFTAVNDIQFIFAKAVFMDFLVRTEQENLRL